jgi:hypothetical protein
MRFRKKSLDQMTQRLVELGLSKCPICQTGAILVSPRPAIISVGGFHHEKDDPRYDPEANVIFAVKLTCDVCGHMMLFDSEKFSPGDERSLIKGLSVEQEAEWEARQDRDDE